MLKAGFESLIAEYRLLRKDSAPDIAWRMIATRLQFGVQLLINLERPNAATDLEQLLGWVQVNMELAAERRLRGGRCGRYWQTGKLTIPLCYTVQGRTRSDLVVSAVKCDNPGCAIKHALSMFRSDHIATVTIDANRPGVSYRLTPRDNMTRLSELSWPVD